MALREAFSTAQKASMQEGDAPRTSALRMIAAKLKDSDIAARPGPPLADDQVVQMLRSMVKSRRESVALYEQGNRPELAAKEAAEIAVIEGFLPRAMDAGTLGMAVDDAITETGAVAMKDMGRVMAALKAAHGAALDAAAAGAIVRKKLG